jgi:hypothetical protein
MQYLRRQAEEMAKVFTTVEDLMDYLKNNDDISFVALYHNSQVPASSNYHSHPSGRPPQDGTQSIQDINKDLTMTVPGGLESISQLNQGTAVLSEYKNYSADVDKTTYEYIQNSRISQGVSPTAWGIRSQIRHFWSYPETDTTFKTNNEQRPFLMICSTYAVRQHGNSVGVSPMFFHRWLVRIIQLVSRWLLQMGTSMNTPKYMQLYPVPSPVQRGDGAGTTW